MLSISILPKQRTQKSVQSRLESSLQCLTSPVLSNRPAQRHRHAVHEPVIAFLPKAWSESNHPEIQADYWLLHGPANSRSTAYKSNRAAITPPLERTSIQDMAQDLAKHYAQHFGRHLQTMRRGLQPHGTLSGRPKTSFSIADKLRRKAAEEERGLLTAYWAQSRISDGLGFRLTLHQGNPAEVDACVESIVKLLHRGEFQIVELANYHGPDTLPYLSDQHIRTLRQANTRAPKNTTTQTPMQVLHHLPEALKKSGYTAFQLKIRFPDGTLGELQIRGPQVEKIACVEHLVYDIRKHKTLPGKHGTRSSGSSRSQLETFIRSLTTEQAQDYLQYLAQHYQKARQLELGESKGEALSLPDSLKHYAQLDLKRIRGSALNSN